MTDQAASLAERMDRLYEFEREPVTPDKLKPGRYFAGLLAGEHVAATEFVIGAFFVLHGVTFRDLILGLLVGNTLAVLTWTFVCAPIAVRTRLTLYWYLRRIAGPGLTALYNVANAVMYCILAGSMIAVSSTALGLAFNVPSPALSDVLPNSVGWVLITLCIGAVITMLAIVGFEGLSRFSTVCSPWIFIAFIAGAIAVLPALGVRPDFSNFLEIANTRIWNGVPTAGQEKFTMWHVMFFAWLANLAMHIGLSDMALFRYAKNWKYGLYTAAGVFPGHMLCWICSGIMVAAVDRAMDPGRMAYVALGISGGLAVLLAGWTTANPTLYRAGLALQIVTPNWQRWKVTLFAGAVTTVLACFPVVFVRLLDYVGVYGLVLMPIGAVVFAEHWLLPRLGIEQYQAEKRHWVVNVFALVTWVATLAVCYALPLHLFFCWLPGYFFALILYTGLMAAFSKTARPVGQIQQA